MAESDYAYFETKSDSFLIDKQREFAPPGFSPFLALLMYIGSPFYINMLYKCVIK